MNTLNILIWLVLFDISVWMYVFFTQYLIKEKLAFHVVCIFEIRWSLRWKTFPHKCLENTATNQAI